ncbi:hypothetical protein GCM10023184_23240 [Flaviaesturariibacter amylovorans]|uniref:Tetratricopeptide repeat protein n=1 Tax=Flaviaesturariibacter amylovorans TaxID=1084520 RepID=A0ABP8GYG6_9BACT
MFFKGDSAELPGLYRHSIDRFEEAYRLDSTNRHAWMRLPDCYYQLGAYERAIFWSQRELRSPGLSAELVALAYQTIGFCQLQLGRLDAAKATFRDVLRRYRGADDQQSRGFLFMKLEQVAGELYARRNGPSALAFTKAGIDPCRYSVEAYRFFVTVREQEEGFLIPPYDELLAKREQGCR